ncbi:MAG TPA: nucleotidyltransferase domain-containing protein [bacterium]|nr:nucleotidyltransferase domain-containing protein [bacterium]
MFTIEERDGIRDRILAIAHADPRIVAGAMIGSLTQGLGDRWSDLDLGFGVGDGATPAEVLADWTPRLERECQAVHLFDLASGAAIYRVFLFPGALQVDLSFAPAAGFGARGPKFRLLFGAAVEHPRAEPPSAPHLFGLGVHHAVRARFCVERGRLWQAQHWISELREIGLTLACRRRELETAQGRGYDELPSEALKPFEETLVRALDRAELLRALRDAIDGLLREAGEARALAVKVEGQLRELTSRDFRHR